MEHAMLKEGFIIDLVEIATSRSAQKINLLLEKIRLHICLIQKFIDMITCHHLRLYCPSLLSILYSLRIQYSLGDHVHIRTLRINYPRVWGNLTWSTTCMHLPHLAISLVRLLDFGCLAKFLCQGTYHLIYAKEHL